MTKSNIKKILLADDDRDDRDLFSEALAILDPQIVCEEAKDGNQALDVLETLKSDQPSVIFVDINMPVMNGWDLLRKLKSDQQYVNIPVIVYSTSSKDEDRTIAYSLGALCFVTKPTSFTLIKGMLSVVINHLETQSISDICDQIHKTLRA